MEPVKNVFKIAVLVGSLRQESLSLKMANALIKLSPDDLEPEIVTIGTLPMYNEDLETDHPPVEWVKFRDEIKSVQGILLVTPEYNRSVPAVLKNALDVGSAPHGKNVFDSKPAAIVSLSPGMMGAFGANHHLRQSLVFLNVPAMQQPEAYIGSSEMLFDAAGSLVKESTQLYLQKFMQAFAGWVKRHQKAGQINQF